MLSLIHEVRVTARQLRKSTGFAATVILTLALGITATTVIFSLVDAVLLRPLPLPEPDRLISLDTLERPAGTSGAATIRNDTSYPNFFDWRRQNKSFSSMASYTTGGLVLGADANGPARRLGAVQVSSDFFTTLGVAPELGRGFTRSEELPGTRTVVLSHNIWQTEFAGDRNILGKTIVLSDMNYTVIGVMPAGFAFPVSNADEAFWISMARDAEGKNPSSGQRGYNQLSVVGRLRPGVTLAQAKAEMDSIQRGLAAQYPDDDQNLTAVSVVPQLQDIVSDVRTPLSILFAAVCSLLLIVCANIAGLLLTRINQRRGELAIRSALGASRLQILRQLLIESVLLSLSGGALGICATAVLLRVLSRILPANLPRVHQIALSGPVLLFAIGISVVTGLLFGVLPAWRASLQDPAKALGDTGRGGLAGRTAISAAKHSGGGPDGHRTGAAGRRRAADSELQSHAQGRPRLRSEPGTDLSHFGSCQAVYRGAAGTPLSSISYRLTSIARGKVRVGCLSAAAHAGRHQHQFLDRRAAYCAGKRTQRAGQSD